MTKIWWMGAVLLACLAASTARAQSECAQFQIVGSAGSASYNPFDPQQNARSFGLRVRRVDDRVREVRFRLVDTTPGIDGPQLGQGGPALYDIQWLPDAGRRIFGVGNEALNANNTVDVTFDQAADAVIVPMLLTVPRGQAVTYGRHSESVGIDYQCMVDTDANGFTADQRNANLLVDLDVPAYTAAFVGGVGQTRGAIAFGTLSARSATADRSISITALSTVPYDISFESEHGGTMARVSGGSGAIDYRMRLDALPIASGTTLTCPATPAPQGAISEFRVAVDTASVAMLPAGDYADTITITVLPRLGDSSSSCRVTRSIGS